MASTRFQIWADELGRGGTLNPVQLGMNQKQIIGLFGDPDDSSTMRKAGLPQVLKYGAIEFHFGDPSPSDLWLIYSETNLGETLISIDANTARTTGA